MDRVHNIPNFFRSQWWQSFSRRLAAGVLQRVFPEKGFGLPNGALFVFRRTAAGLMTETANVAHISRILILLLIVQGSAAVAETSLNNQFIEAVSAGDVAEAKALLGRGAAVEATGLYGTRPLHMAALEHDRAMVKLLLAAGADVNAVNELNQTPAILAAGDADLLGLLLDAGVPVEAKSKSGETLLMAAAAESAAAVELLLSRGADVKARDAAGRGVLHHAIGTTKKKQVAAIFDLLVAAGAPMNIPDSEGRTPLMMAAIFPAGGIGEKLLAAGVDPWHLDKYGNTALDFTVRDLRVNASLLDALIKRQPPQVQLDHALVTAVESDLVDGIRRLHGAGASLGTNRQGEPLLGLAIQKGAWESIRELGRLGVPVNGLSASGGSALAAAMRKGDTDVVRLLLNLGADPNQPIAGEQPLYVALKKSDADMFGMLVAAGARTDFKVYGLPLPEALRADGNEQALAALRQGASQLARRQHGLVTDDTALRKVLTGVWLKEDTIRLALNPDGRYERTVNVLFMSKRDAGSWMVREGDLVLQVEEGEGEGRISALPISLVNEQALRLRMLNVQTYLREGTPGAGDEAPERNRKSVSEEERIAVRVQAQTRDMSGVARVQELLTWLSERSDGEVPASVLAQCPAVVNAFVNADWELAGARHAGKVFQLIMMGEGTVMTGKEMVGCLATLGAERVWGWINAGSLDEPVTFALDSGRSADPARVLASFDRYFPTTMLALSLAEALDEGEEAALDRIQALLAVRGNPGGRMDNGMTYLEFAAENQMHSILQLLLQAGAKPVTQGRGKTGPLVRLVREVTVTPGCDECSRAHLDSIKALLDAGADIDGTDEEGGSVFWYASGYPTLEQYLHQRGAKVRTAPRWAYSGDLESDLLTSLEHGDWKRFTRLLATPGLSKETLQSAVATATRCNRVDGLKALAQAGADLTGGPEFAELPIYEEAYQYGSQAAGDYLKSSLGVR